MVSTTCLDEILSVLKHAPESYSQAHTALQHLSAPNDEATLFLRLLEDCMSECALPINHEDSPSFINIYKDNFKHKDEFEYGVSRSTYAASFLQNCFNGSRTTKKRPMILIKSSREAALYSLSSF